MAPSQVEPERPVPKRAETGPPRRGSSVGSDEGRLDFGEWRVVRGGGAAMGVEGRTMGVGRMLKGWPFLEGTGRDWGGCDLSDVVYAH